MVEALASYGIPHIEIGTVIGIDPKTLRKHYGLELETAAIKANAMVAQSLFAKATSKGITGPSVTAAIFWLKVRAGWKETTIHEHGGKNGGPIEYCDLSALSDEELDLLEKLRAKIAQPGSDPGGESA
ncbi:MAG TPA: hypothetical protein VIF40_18115 [Methylosinus sp.]|jgi:hypothetical protein|uniref:hypothetical protein n=1 Tax=Methylosinus sp. TaxID=427 RepID=UPI002F9314AE